MELEATVSSLWENVLSSRSNKTYSVGFRTYINFLALNGVVWVTRHMPPISEEILIYFIAHCFKNLKLLHTTIKLYLCGIRFHYILNNCPNPLVNTDESSLSRLHMILRAVKRIQGEHKQNQRLPITFQVLGRICNSLRRGVFSTFTDCMLETACTIAFFGFLRCSEFTTLQTFDPSFNLCIGDVHIFINHAVIHLKASKTDPFRKGVDIQLHQTNHNICPFTVLKRYLAIRKGRGAPVSVSDPLFIKDDGNPLDRYNFIRSLKHILDICGLNSTLYNGHSFRIGASTSAGAVNIQDHLIKTLGRWSSDSYCRYVRTSSDTIRDAQKSLTLIK